MFGCVGTISGKKNCFVSWPQLNEGNLEHTPKLFVLQTFLSLMVWVSWGFWKKLNPGSPFGPNLAHFLVGNPLLYMDHPKVTIPRPNEEWSPLGWCHGARMSDPTNGQKFGPFGHFLGISFYQPARFESMIFLLQWWDMLVSWRVGFVFGWAL